MEEPINNLFILTKSGEEKPQERKIYMSLKRSFLKDILTDENLSDGEKIQKIIDGHMETVITIQDKLDIAEKEVRELQKVKEKLEGYKEYKDKYENEHRNFEQFKTEISNKESYAQKEKSYRDMLKKAGIAEKYIDSVLKITNLSECEFDEKNSLKDTKTAIEKTKEQFADFIEKRQTKGVKNLNPPSNTGGNTFAEMPLEEKMAYANENPKSEEVLNWLKK